MNYRVSFYRYKKKKDEKGKETIDGQEHLGSITVDDAGTDKQHTLMAKAFRQAPEVCLLADKVKLEEVYV